MHHVAKKLAYATAFLGSPALAVAPEAESPEIVVRGERQDRTEVDTTSSVALVTERELKAASADRIDQILANIPNVQLGSGGEGPTIRGQDTTGVLRDLPAFLGGTRPRATLQVDGRAVGYSELAFGTAPLWDVAQVEVFRSPQSTTQGRNSIAGAIFVASNDPTFDWQARGRALAGTFRTRQLSMVVSGPLANDQLAFRMTGDLRRGRSSSVITTAAPNIDPNRDDYELLRFKLLATPRAFPGLRAVATVATTSSQAPQIEGVRAPFRRRRDPEATYGIFKSDVTSMTVLVEQTFSPRLTGRGTISFGDTLMRRFAPAGFGETRISGVDRSAEIVFDWTANNSLRFVGGTHWLWNDLDQRIDLTAARLGRGEFADHQKSFGVFGEAEWQFLPRLLLTAGGRHQSDRQVRLGTLGIGARHVPLDYRGRFDAFLPKASLSYAIDEDSRFGILVQRAYNPGGVTISLANFAPDTFSTETLWDYEVFARASLAGGALKLSGNVFYYAMRNAQRSLVRELVTPGGTVFFSETANAPAARSRGAELTVEWNPARSVAVDAAIGLLGTHLTETLSAADPLLDKQFQRSPHFTGSLAVQWNPFLALHLSAQIRHNSGYFSDDANDPERRVSAATTVNARVEWTHGKLTLFGYGRNVLNSFYLTYLFAAGSQLATAGDPREFGFGLEGRF